MLDECFERAILKIELDRGFPVNITADDNASTTRQI